MEQVFTSGVGILATWGPAYEAPRSRLHLLICTLGRHFLLVCGVQIGSENYNIFQP